MKFLVNTTRKLVFASMFFWGLALFSFYIFAMHEYVLCGDIPYQWPNVSCDNATQIFSGIILAVFTIASLFSCIPLYINNRELLKKLLIALAVYAPFGVLIVLFGLIEICLMWSCSGGDLRMVWPASYFAIIIVLAISWSELFARKWFEFFMFIFVLILSTYFCFSVIRNTNDESYRIRGYVESQNVSGCSSSMIPLVTQYCIQAIAVSKLDINMCTKIEATNSRNNCLNAVTTGIAGQNADITYCNKIEDVGWKKECDDKVQESQQANILSSIGNMTFDIEGKQIVFSGGVSKSFGEWRVVRGTQGELTDRGEIGVATVIRLMSPVGGDPVDYLVIQSTRPGEIVDSMVLGRGLWPNTVTVVKGVITVGLGTWNQSNTYSRTFVIKDGKIIEGK